MTVHTRPDPFNLSEFKPGAILANTDDTIHCRINSIEAQDAVRLTLLDNQVIEGRLEFSASISELARTGWRLTKEIA